MTSSCTLRYKIGKLNVISKNDVKLVENIHKNAVYYKTGILLVIDKINEIGR